ncbi:MAG: zinc ribbon domain-containing protein [Anaerolineae bacterium]|nr:zinc ribbon domain-containing protein [Anaerolineae bacterium]
MIKRRLPSIVLLLVLGVLIVTYIAATSDFAAEIYTHDQQQALLVHERLRLTQAAPVSNFYRGYVGDELIVLEANEVDAPGVAAAMGATDCRVRAALNARYEEVEGFTTTVYDLDFEGTYKLRYTGAVPTTTLELIFPFPTGLDTLNQVYFLVDGEEPSGVQYSLNNITWWTEMASGDEREVTVRYRARGVGSFRYALEHNRRLENLDVEITVHGLSGSEVVDGSLPTTAFEDAEDGEQFLWRYDALIADRDVQVELPTRMSFLQRVEQLREPMRRIALASPVLVAFFVASLAGLHRLGGVRLPLQHYLLAGLGFFLFYPALTFLSGVFELPLAAAVALFIVTGLLISFLGRAIGWRRAWLQTLLLCAVFLGLFSLGAMSQLRGLLFTTGGLLLLGAFMLLVARQRPSAPAIDETDPGEPSEGPGSEADEAAEPTEVVLSEDQSAAELSVEVNATEIPATVPTPPTPMPPSRYCPHCGGPLDEAFAFCPACGRDAKPFHRCPACGAEHYVSPETELSHCPACGERMSESANE